MKPSPTSPIWWQQIPMLRVALPVVGGILVAQYFALPLLYLWCCVLLLGLFAWWLPSNGATIGALFFAGWLIVEIHHQRVEPPLGEPLCLQLRIEEEPRPRARGYSVAAAVEAWQRESIEEWVAGEVNLVLHTDTTWQPRSGERLLAVGTLHPFSADYPEYASLMFRRGYRGHLWLRQTDLLERDSVAGSRDWIRRLHRAALHRLDRLQLSPASRAVVEAMAVGERRGLTPELREAYARSGTSHLLAVSGLHVGIIFLVVNTLLGGLTLLNHGHRWRNLLVILLIWLYAGVVGGAPSVLRAAAMFSVLQLAQMRTQTYSALNTLFGVGVGMLLLNPDWLFDVSFQLSFLAVLGILIVPKPRPLRLRGVQWLVSSLWISLVAALATAPMVSFHFGILSPIGVVVNPPIILLSELLLILALGWVLLPISPLASLASALLEGVAGWQNRWVERIARWEHSSLDYTLSGWSVVGIYLLFFLLLAGYGLLKSKKVGIFAQRNNQTKP